MHRKLWVAATLVLSLFLLTTNEIRAERVPSRKVVSTRVPGVRGDITVPYLTNGFTTLGVYQGVAPLIYHSPTVYNPVNPQVRAVFNLPFYGATHSFGGQSDGAVSRPKSVAPH